MIVDSHCHLNMLDLTPYDGKLEGVLTAAKANGVEHMLSVSTSLETFPRIISIAERFPHITASVGIHPVEKLKQEPKTNDLLALANHPLVVAIGETGLDYFHVEPGTKWQQERFCQHIDVAKKTRKPLIIHTRDARNDTIAIMKSENASECAGVMHCFTETWEIAKQALDLGFYISFSGIVTFKNAKDLQEVAKKVPIDRMLIETDAPFLAPTPFRGKPNEPAYVKYVAEFLSHLRGISYEELAKNTTDNFFRLFSQAQQF